MDRRRAPQRRAMATTSLRRSQMFRSSALPLALRHRRSPHHPRQEQRDRRTALRHHHLSRHRRARRCIPLQTRHRRVPTRCCLQRQLVQRRGLRLHQLSMMLLGHRKAQRLQQQAMGRQRNRRHHRHLPIRQKSPKHHLSHQTDQMCQLRLILQNQRVQKYHPHLALHCCSKQEPQQRQAQRQLSARSCQKNQRRPLSRRKSHQQHSRC
mmetsp:Transcript_40598/g.116127  ORF Transcript_40598/g.116127 Transcript_40598/m.116127 type:complete len:209 (-) Transcript_40598:3186-3812(-)